jgi:WNK lysine deficient protein kinase
MPGEETEQENTSPVCDEGRFTRSSEFLSSDLHSIVYRAFDEETAVEVAWVEYNNVSSEQSAALSNVAKVLVTLEHPNLLKYYKGWADTKAKKFVFVTEVTTSGNLKRFLQRKVHMKPNVIRNWSQQVLEGLTYLHDAGLVHLDLRCENIFISGNVSKVQVGALEKAALLEVTHPADLAASPGFAAPELKPGQPADLYSYGMTVLQMFTYEPPYSECRTAAEIWSKVSRKKPPRALSKVKKDAIHSFIKACIRHDPSERPTAKELLDHTFLTTDYAAGELVVGEADPAAEDASFGGPGADAAATALNVTATDIAPESVDGSVVGGGDGLTRSTSAGSDGEDTEDEDQPVTVALEAKVYLEEEQRAAAARAAAAAAAAAAQTAAAEGAERAEALARRASAKPTFMKCYYDATGAEAGSMECVRLRLDGVQSVRDLKKQIIADFSLSIMASILAREQKRVIDETDLTQLADQAGFEKGEGVVGASGGGSGGGGAGGGEGRGEGEGGGSGTGEVVEDDDEAMLTKMKLKYRDADGDFCTIIDRTPLSEVLEHAVSFHVYLLEVANFTKMQKRKKLAGLIEI